MATEKNEVSLWLVVLAVLGLIVWSILPDRWTEPIKYAVEYGIGTDQVHWNAKPTDCDWGHAPLGDKGCHYKKTVTGYNAAGNVVAGDDAPTYGHDANTAKPIISYDKGKTWKWLPEDTPDPPDLRVKSVEIEWTKVED